MKRIIYKTAEGGVAIVIPAEQALLYLTVDEIAKKDVPTGFHYAIVEASEIPTERADRDRWDIDNSELTDGVGQ